MNPRNAQIAISLVFAVIVIIVVIRVVQTKKENYEPENMGSRRYWGQGREYGYSIRDHYEDHGPCYPLRIHDVPCPSCLPGYSLKFNKKFGDPMCCVNRSNY